MCIFELNKFNSVKFILKSKQSICQNWKQLQQFLPGEFYAAIPLLPRENITRLRYTSFPYFLQHMLEVSKALRTRIFLVLYKHNKNYLEQTVTVKPQGTSLHW